MYQTEFPGNDGFSRSPARAARRPSRARRIASTPLDEDRAERPPHDRGQARDTESPPDHPSYVRGPGAEPAGPSQGPGRPCRADAACRRRRSRRTARSPTSRPSRGQIPESRRAGTTQPQPLVPAPSGPPPSPAVSSTSPTVSTSPPSASSRAASPVSPTVSPSSPLPSPPPSSPPSGQAQSAGQEVQSSSGSQVFAAGTGAGAQPSSRLQSSPGWEGVTQLPEHPPQSRAGRGLPGSRRSCRSRAQGPHWPRVAILVTRCRHRSPNRRRARLRSCACFGRIAPPFRTCPDSLQSSVQVTQSSPDSQM